MCHYALKDFWKARTMLVGALELCKDKQQSVSDYMQLAEILNNLGCLSFLLNHPIAAKKMIKESVQVQLAIQTHMVYIGNKQSRYSACLNMSVTQANIGYLKLSTRDYSAAVSTFQATLLVSSCIIFRLLYLAEDDYTHIITSPLKDPATPPR